MNNFYIGCADFIDHRFRKNIVSLFGRKPWSRRWAPCWNPRRRISSSRSSSQSASSTPSGDTGDPERGDLGRSPRMQHHAISLAKEGFNVDLFGFGGSRPFPEIVENRKIFIYRLSESLGFHTIFPRPVQYVYKATRQSISIFFALYLRSKKPSHVLLQNPPGLPAIAVAKLICLLQGSRLIIDWHNYGFSILGLRHPESSLVVRIARWYEGVFGRTADDHFCVTAAMKSDLLSRWGIEARVLYDRPARMSGPTFVDERHDLFVKLAGDYKVFAASEPSDVATSGVLDETAFTRSFLLEADEDQKDSDDVDGESEKEDVPWVVLHRRRRCVLREDRPALLVSSTSWTADEDFAVLLRALDLYDDEAKEDYSLPRLVCAITGKGPEKARYIDEIGRRNWSRVSACTPWLEPEDYPLLLGSADLGVCLHASSSGLDLPMKVVDMFGSGLPVCAVNFRCLSELVRHGENGFVFEDSPQLARQIRNCFRGFPSSEVAGSADGGPSLRGLRQNLSSFSNEKWHDSWTREFLPVLRPRKND